MTEMSMLILSISPFYSEIFLYAFASCPLLKLFKDRSSDQNFRSVLDILYQSPKRCFCNVYKSVYSMSLSAAVCVACSLASMSKKTDCFTKICSFLQHEQTGKCLSQHAVSRRMGSPCLQNIKIQDLLKIENRDHFFFFPHNA